MGDKTIDNPNSSSTIIGEKMASTEPVRSRWTPKPEQILILESIFNSGMVNPPKDETVRIRKLLEKFGAVGDANVFYWFQNRRSRSRRRQRQMQAVIASAPGLTRPGGCGGGVILCEKTSLTTPSSINSSSSTSSVGGSGGATGFLTTSPASNSTGVACFSSNNLVGDDGADDLFTISRQMGFPEFGETPLPMMIPTSASLDFHYQQLTGPLTVFINGIPSEVPSGPVNTRTMFGNDVMLLHSSGEIVPSNEHGVLNSPRSTNGGKLFPGFQTHFMNG